MLRAAFLANRHQEAGGRGRLACQADVRACYAAAGFVRHAACRQHAHNFGKCQHAPNSPVEVRCGAPGVLRGQDTGGWGTGRVFSRPGFGRRRRTGISTRLGDVVEKSVVEDRGGIVVPRQKMQGPMPRTRQRSSIRSAIFSIHRAPKTPGMPIRPTFQAVSGTSPPDPCGPARRGFRRYRAEAA